MTDLALDALATFRLSKLIVDDVILDGPRNRFVDRMTAAGHPKLVWLAGCPWCVSPYVAVAVIVARRVFPRAWPACARVLAFSAVAGILSER